MISEYNEDLESMQSWIHDLAFAEKNTQVAQLLVNNELKTQVKKSTATFIGLIKKYLIDFSHIFNGLSESGALFNEVKIYATAQSTTDFMLYRNQLKLVFCTPTEGIIQIFFPDPQNPSKETKSSQETAELLAQTGPFQEVFWTFQGEKVQALQVARFYFSQFIHMTRIKNEESSNQLLFNQIKALLQEKGFQL